MLVLFLSIRILTTIVIVLEVYFEMKGDYRTSRNFAILVIGLLLISIGLGLGFDEPLVSAVFSWINLLLIIGGWILTSRKAKRMQ